MEQFSENVTQGKNISFCDLWASSFIVCKPKHPYISKNHFWHYIVWKSFFFIKKSVTFSALGGGVAVGGHTFFSDMLDIASDSVLKPAVLSRYLSSWHKEMVTRTLEMFFSLGLKHAKTY